jgi:8-oxo-dGTP pyrophosphatase MutT (NUDIX family)
MPWTTDFEIKHEDKTVQLVCETQNSTAAFTALINRAIDQDTFKIIHGQHSEPYPIIGAKHPVSLERYAAPLFGIISRGAHLTAYTRTPTGLKIWVPRRSPNLFTYPNCLDTTVAGGVTAGEGPFECVVREAGEEASLPGNLVKEKAKAVGCVSYVSHKDAPGNSEKGLFAPDIVYVYDLELDGDSGVVCKKCDEEVEEFYLMGVEEVKESLGSGEWKTNSACVMIDFFVRHGVIAPEGDYAEIVARVHRRLPFPTSPGQ